MRRNTESYHQHLKAERDEVEGLRSLLASTPSDERRARVLAGLQSKYEGAQSVATQVLGVWGDRESVEMLRQRLVSLLARSDAFALRGVTVAALARWIAPVDTNWVLDLYFSRPDWYAKYELFELASAVDAATGRSRVLTELRGPDPLNREAAARVIGRVRYSDWRELIDEYHRGRSS